MKRKLYFILAALVILGSLSFTACDGSPDGVYNLEFRTIRYAKAGLYVGNNPDYNDITYDFDYSLAKTILATPQDKESAKKTVTMKEGELITVKHEALGPDRFVAVTAKRKDNNKFLKVTKISPWEDMSIALRQFTMPASDITITVTYIDNSLSPIGRKTICYPNKSDAAEVAAKGGYIETDHKIANPLPCMELYLLATPNPGKKLSSISIQTAETEDEVTFTPTGPANLTLIPTDNPNVFSFIMPDEHLIINAVFEEIF